MANLGCILNGHDWLKSNVGWFSNFYHKCKNCGDKVKCLWHGRRQWGDCFTCQATLMSDNRFRPESKRK
jgi:hypothetical protein